MSWTAALRRALGWGGGSAPPSTGSLLAQAAVWAPTHRHRKGGLYRVLGYGTLEADRKRAVIYDDEAGTVWIRPASEFEDGRFEALDPVDKL